MTRMGVLVKERRGVAGEHLRLESSERWEVDLWLSSDLQEGSKRAF